MLIFWGQGGFRALESWAIALQRTTQDALAGGLRALRAGQPGALVSLLGLCFAYGFFHAVGPGHGKFLIGGYGVARRVRMAPLAAIAVASSLAQATTAVVIVLAGVWIFDWSRAQVETVGDDLLTPISHLAIALLGLWLVWRGASALFRAGAFTTGTRSAMAGEFGLSSVRRPAISKKAGHPAALDAPYAARAGGQGDAVAGWASAGHPEGDGHQHSHAADGNHIYSHAHSHTHGHPAEHSPGTGDLCHTCGHSHGPSLEQVAQVTGVRSALALIVGVALRPCTGALFVLIVTWKMGILWAGVAGAYAMGLGTASVTLAVAALAVWAREGAFAMMPGGRALRAAVPIVELTAGALIAVVSLGLLMRAL
ncbi:MAG: hypothetical protein Q7J57_15490 [Gemmobacter sp.]|nr:hypothetical protein [Gemmobacter sp.]